ncbi:SDR family oxidoreductase [Luteimonas sp. Y-2-2-4F]|nr:SDR family NAD(P)-dependent oxidoreductase [Luteimonas sp. Y-2-2-4F]MCD9033812.1 SDR family oxidoreductase [Luteimonas sp. Y-2-2-4F]
MTLTEASGADGAPRPASTAPIHGEHDAMRNRLLEGKRAIVTGAGSGIGRAIAALFHAHGAQVVLADLDAASAQAAAQALDAARCHGRQADVASEASVRALVESTVARLGGIDVLVNCAGVPQRYTVIEALEEAHWERILGVNAKSVFLTCKHAVPHMKRQGGGTIVNIGSIVGVRPKPGQNAYCASKAAVIALSQSLALELACDGIRVNVVNPGAAETPMLAGFVDPARTPLEEAKRSFASNIPMGALIQPDDVAEAVLYLASPLSRQVTGAVFNVDGGRGV